MKLNLAGLLRERLPSGNYRYRVRVEGKPSKRIRLHVTPDHEEFIEHYRAARRGIELEPESKPIDRTIRGSMAWLILKYLDHLQREVEAGIMSPLTLKKKGGLLERLKEQYGEYSMLMPTKQVIKIRDSLIETPASADSTVSAIRQMYKWAVERDICEINPAVGVGTIDKGKGGAIPWTVEDLQKYRATHPPGTTAHLCLSLLMFTACRIGDAAVLGRANEFERDGVKGLGWQPKKKGSAYVEIPMLPPLYKATRAAPVQGKTYLLNAYGKSFKTADSLGQRFSKWCDQAGLPNRSSHGIRKAAGHLLAQEGCSQYQIMSVHGHTEAQTSEVYTKGVQRWRLAADAMKRLEGMDW